MTDPINIARQEGIALGLAMARQIVAELSATSDSASGHTSTGPNSYGAGYDAGERAVIHQVGVAIEAITSIPPRVAAARVLLDAMDPAIWRAAIMAIEPILRADISSSAWNDEDEIMAALTAALEQIAKEGA